MKRLLKNKTRFLCEELEPRILLSAGAEGLIFEAEWEPEALSAQEMDAAQIVALFDNNQSSNSSEPALELVFIDSSLPNYQSLVADITENSDASRNFEIVLLNNEHDGISQVTSYLQSQNNVDAIHFITHGQDSQVQLGNTLVNQNNIEDYSSDFLLWQSALDDNADILFYGCDLASSDDGISLIQTISALTNADVAASDDITGNAQLDGDWDLEQEVGSIETTIVFSTELQNSWTGILPILTFQEGVNSYTGTVDTQIDQLTPNTVFDDEADISADGGANQKMGLIRFDNIFGAGANQIEYGSTINSASLTFNVTSSSLNGSDNVQMHAMLVSWTDSATWNSFSSVGNTTAGVQLDDTDADSTADSSLGNPKGATGAKEFTGLESTLQSWSDGGTNYGWVIVNDSTNNWNFSQAEDAEITNPILTVDYTTNTAPVITSGSTPSVVENSTAVTTVTATDADGDTPTFSITGVTADDALFSIDANTGVLTFNAAPNFESPGDVGGDNTYNITVTANDGNGGTTDQAIAITVTNTNEGAPVFTSSTTQSVAENTTAVTTVTASDVDTNDTITYSITGGTADDALFSITAGGVLTFDAAPNFENPGDIGGNNVYDIEVTANDGNGGVTTQNIAITVTNVNEGAPVFTSSNSTSIAENTTAVMTVTANDVDTNDTITYSITGGTADDALFSITAGGVLTFDAAPDFENPGDIGGNNVYDIEVTANDGNGGITTQNIAISVTNTNEGAPVFTSSTTQSVAENTTAVTTVTATDVDTNDTITYSITGGTADDALFSITAGGVLTFDAAPDFENPGDIGGNNVYDIEVTANDGNGGVTTQNIAISVTNTNEGAPVFTSSTTQSVAENTTAVTTVTATDVDINDTIIYSITGGTADDALFSITAGGVLTFDAAPDFENPGDIGGDNTYNIEVTANDGNGGVTTQNIAITVTNTNEGAPVFTSSTTQSLAENTTAVTTVTATDVDINDTITYSITGGTADDALFSITPGGVLTFNAAPDFENPGDIGGNNVYDIEVTANDGNGGVTTQNIAITVTNTNEGAPVFTSSTTQSVAENTTAVTTVTATDVDINDTITYSITGGTADDALFSITPGGVLTFNAAPDFENPGDMGGNNVYDIEVTANDANGGVTTQNIAITVTNVNEGAPVFTSSTTQSVAENTTAVTTVTATDVDINDTITYSITGGTADDALFSITPGGVLTFNAAPDFENPGDIGGNNVYDIEVTANDGNGRITTQNIAITVTNTNEGAPVFTSSTAQSVAENTTAVTTVTATDVDINDTITYSITGGTADDALFSITPGGVLTFNAAPDFENPGDIGGNNVYDIEVTANDGNGGVTTQNIAVTVTNANEAPVITSGGATTVSENSTAVMTVTATDVDGDIPLFSITGGADAALFSIDPNTGVLTFNTAPDFENPADSGADNNYDVQVTANDGNGAAAVQNITITVANSNDAPVISDQEFYINGDSFGGSIVGVVTGGDTDINDTLTYSITDGTGLGVFAIDSSSGEIFVVNSLALNSDTMQVFTISVTVTDSSGATSVALVTISVAPTTGGSSDTNPDSSIPIPPAEEDHLSGEGEEDTFILNRYVFASTHQQVLVEEPEQNETTQVTLIEPAVPETVIDKSGSKVMEPLSPFKTAALVYKTGGSLSDALDAMRKNIDESAEKQNQNPMQGGIRASGIVLTAGFASWVLRGSSLLASFLSTIPIWRGLDPLPILGGAKNDPKDAVNIHESTKEDSASDDIDLIFSKPANNVASTTETDSQQGKDHA